MSAYYGSFASNTAAVFSSQSDKVILSGYTEITLLCRKLVRELHVYRVTVNVKAGFLGGHKKSIVFSICYE